MPSYRPPISQDEYHYLEAYYFRLVMFTDTIEYREMKSLPRQKIDQEIMYMSIALNIMSKLFSIKGGTERAVVAWEKDPDPELKFKSVHHFSCIKVASMALNCNKSEISAVCKGLREHTGGWIFQYEDDYEETQNYTFDPNNTKFEFK